MATHNKLKANLKGQKARFVMQYHQQKLTNGLETLFIDSPGSSAATVQIWFRAGSALEENGDEGIAHFLEHMFFKGTPERPGAAIAHEVESFGGEINAFTSFDYTCYYINSPHSNIDQTINILMDMVCHPEFKESELLPERDVVFEEYRRSQDNPNHYSFMRLQEEAFKGGYGHPILGSEKTIKNFSRDQLVKFRLANYNLSNALLIVAGDLKDKEKYIQSIEKYHIPHGPASVFPRFGLQEQSKIDVHEKDVRMSTLTLVTQAPEFDSTEAASEDLAINCLGHGETSRLYKKLVQDSGIANNCSSSTMFMAKGGAHFIRVVFPHKNISKVFDVLAQTMNETVGEGFDRQEAQRIKNQYLASKIYERESIESFAFSLGHGHAQNGDIDCEEEFISRIKNTTLAQVNGAYRSISKRSIHACLQVPRGESLEKSKNEVTKLLKNIKEGPKKSKENNKLIGKYTTSKVDPQVKLITIKKGIQLIHRYNNMTPTFVFHAYLKGGLAHETAKTNGQYQLLSSLLTSGHKEADNDTFKADLEDKSSSISGFSGKNAYGLTLHGLSDYFSDLMGHFFNCLLFPTIPKKYLQLERELVLRTLENQKEDPVRQCFFKVASLVFKGHPYAMNALGTKDSLKKITTDSLLKLHKKNLKSSNIVFTYCGDLEAEEVVKLVKEKLSKVPERLVQKPLVRKYTPIAGQKFYIPFDREQTQIFIGIPAPKVGHKDHLFLKVLTTHLSGQSSELFVEVRDRQGLCYSAQPVHFTAQEGGHWGIYMASGHDKVTKAIEAIVQILDNVKNDGLKLHEFERVKKMIEGQSEINIQTNDDYANVYSVPVIQGNGLDFYYENNQAIRDLDYATFQKGIKKILSAKWNQIVVGRSPESI